MEDKTLDIKKISDLLKTAPPKSLPFNFAEQVVATALEQNHKSSWFDAFFAFWNTLFQPRQVLLRPAWQMAWAAMLCLVSATATGWFMRDHTPENVWVRFAIQAPRAQQVALAGDFNAWQSNAIQMEDPNGDGVWHVMVPLHPGIYQYMFILDGEQWIPDPLSNETVDDGFGQKNSLLKVDSTQSPTKGTRHAL